MDARMVMVGIAAGLLLVLLLPTFNALNNSYVHDVKPPPWVPTPSTIPDITPPSDFQPPTDMTPPSGMTPPTNLPPPKDGRIPPGMGCPSPRIDHVLENKTLQMSGTSPQSFSFTLTNRTVYLEGYVNASNWNARSIAGSLSGPSGFDTVDWSEPGQNGILAGNGPDTNWHYQSYNNQTGGKVPPPGRYTLTLSWTSPTLSPTSGKFDFNFGALVCGGGK